MSGHSHENGPLFMKIISFIFKTAFILFGFLLAGGLGVLGLFCTMDLAENFPDYFYIGLGIIAVAITIFIGVIRLLIKWVSQPAPTDKPVV